MRRNTRNTIWLVILSILMMLVVMSPNIAPAAQAVLAGIFLLSMAGVLMDANISNRVLQGLTERVNTRQNRVSPQAREARERAEQRGSYFSDDIELTDIGIITAQSGSEGLVMRRTRTMSRDDDGARPFIVLQIPPEDADRNANVRFEFIDHNGEQRYVHQMSVYLRDGEMNVLADHHLPLYDNDEISGYGDWDLRVYINNVLIGVHNFQLTASTQERQNRARPRGDAERNQRLSADRRDSPMSLEDLLRGQDEMERRG